MRFIYNKFPNDETFQPDETWTPLKEPTDLIEVQIKAIPFFIINFLVVQLLFWIMGLHFNFEMSLLLVAFLIVTPIHELLHALFFPENLLSKNIYFGAILKSGAFFAFYTGEMKRNTFIKVLLAPLAIISIAGVAYLLTFGHNSLVEHIVLFNAFGASVDCLGTYLVLRQIPRKAYVRNKEIKSYWIVKEENSCTEEKA